MNKQGGLLLWIIVLAVLFVGGFIYFAYNFFNTDFEPPSEDERNYCSDVDKNADVCAEVFEPVCGWFDISVQCLKEPCAAMYSNPCFACIDNKVSYWTKGGCED